MAHEMLLGAANWPTGQLSHGVAALPSASAVPAMHAGHGPDVPLTIALVPGGHVIQGVPGLLSASLVPATQLVHVAPPLGAYWPIGQVMQVVLGL